MQEAGFSDNIVAFNTMITGFGKARRMDAAQRLFMRITRCLEVDPDETTYRSMIEGWGRAKLITEMTRQRRLRSQSEKPSMLLFIARGIYDPLFTLFIYF